MSFIDERMRLRRRQIARNTTEAIFERVKQVDERIHGALPIWIEKIQRRRPQLSNELLTELVARMLSNSHLDVSNLRGYEEFRSRLFFATRIVHADGDTTTVNDMFETLRPDSPLRLDQLRQVQQNAVARFRNRVDSAVTTEAHIATINDFVTYLASATGQPPMSVRLDAKPAGVAKLDPATASRREIAAYTDGQVIHLPAVLASTENTAINEAMLVCYLAAHEFLHIAAGSFRFDFRSSQGRSLFRRLLPLRSQYKRRNNGEAITYQLRAKLESEGYDVDALGLKTPPDMVRFFMHFPSPSMAAWLFNAVEDGRLEKILSRHWPGLVKIHRAHDQSYSRDVIRSPYAQSTKGNLISAVGMMAAGRPVVARIDGSHRECVEKAKAILNRYPLSSVYETARVTHKLYMLLQEYLGEDNLEEESQTFRPRVDPEEIAVRRLISDQKKRDSAFDENGKPMSDPLFVPRETGVWYDEYDGKIHHRNVTHVTIKPFTASKQYSPLPSLNQPFQIENLDRRIRTAGDDQNWNDEGEHLATERFAEFRANRTAGYLDTEMRYDLVEDSIPLRVSLLFDLSISMEAPRHALGGDIPIRRAIQYGTWLASALESMNIEVEAYGGISGGPKLCQLFRMPGRPAAISLSMLRCHGFSGFRMGAFIRAFSAHPAELGMRAPVGKHKLIILTDGDEPNYLGAGKESVFPGLWKNNCPGCTSRHRCRIQSVRGGIDQRLGVPDVFQPLGYSLIDAADAISSAAPAMNTKVLLFGGSANDDQYDHYLGAEVWADATRGLAEESLSNW